MEKSDFVCAVEAKVFYRLEMSASNGLSEHSSIFFLSSVYLCSL